MCGTQNLIIHEFSLLKHQFLIAWRKIRARLLHFQNKQTAQNPETAIDQPPDIEVCFSQIISQSFCPREFLLRNDQNRSNQQLFRFPDVYHDVSRLSEKTRNTGK